MNRASPTFPAFPTEHVQRLQHSAQSEEKTMAHTAKLDGSTRMKSRAADRRLCQRITFATAVLLVPVVLAKRIVRALTGSHNNRKAEPLMVEAQADAGAIIPYIFMG